MREKFLQEIRNLFSQLLERYILLDTKVPPLVDLRKSIVFLAVPLALLMLPPMPSPRARPMVYPVSGKTFPRRCMLSLSGNGLTSKQSHQNSKAMHKISAADQQTSSMKTSLTAINMIKINKRHNKSNTA
jgi:hypothetical protein